MAVFNFGKKTEPMTVATFNKEEFEKQEEKEKELKKSRERVEHKCEGFGELDNLGQEIINKLQEEQGDGLSELELKILQNQT